VRDQPARWTRVYLGNRESADENMKVHITADMEGVAGLAHDSQAETKGLDFQRMREIMTGEVQAAIEGAKDGGADNVVVCDAHDTGRNLLLDRLDEDVEVIQGTAYGLGMMAGIGADFDASFQIGYHSMRHTHAGVIGHTYTYTVTKAKLNGVLVGESGLSAAIAGHFGVPLVLVSGDAHAVRQAQQLVKGVVGVPTKEGVGLWGVRTLTPKKAQDLIRKGAKEAMSRVTTVKPYRVRKPVRLEVEFESPLMAQYAADIPLTRRRDIRTVDFRAKDMLEANRIFILMTNLAWYARSEGQL